MASEKKFYITSKTNKKATIWVKVPSIPVSSNYTIYMYFGNASATSESNGDAVFNLYEDFEDNNLNGWRFSGNRGWQMLTTHYEGSYGAQNGNISDNQTSCMYRSVNLSMQGKIRFYWKVDSETDYDYLRFYIDGVQKGNISGNVNWQEKIYNLSSGSHEIKWCYTKDITVSRYADEGYVDFIRVRKYTSLEPTTNVGAEESW